ncbi:MAG TPA: hypothetical protein PK096_02880 [Candidatus Saccharibacteria bacterium]|nr:hypothetical protein [Candidatus Saccharibacteria bacterium]HRK94285.1 hypothetical protein [Candidatus Saccharibacteria bacterium]
MSEKFTSKQDRADSADAVRDFVTVDTNGSAHVPAGSGSKSGNFLSDHELGLIEHNKNLIYDGLENRENEALLDAVGILEDPEDIRNSLAHNGFIDDDEEKNWDEKDITDYVKSTRKEVGSFYKQAEKRGKAASKASASEESVSAEPKPQESQTGKRRADVEVDAPSQAEGYVRRQDRDSGRHKIDIDTTEETGSIYDELSQKYFGPSQDAKDGESLEEYEARNGAGKHRLEVLPTEELDEIADGKSRTELQVLPTDELDAIANGASGELAELPTDELDAIARGDQDDEDDEDETAMPDEASSRWRRWGARAGLAAAETMDGTRIRNWRERRQDREPTRRGKIMAFLAGAALLGVGGYTAYKYGSDVRDMFDGPDGYKSGGPAASPEDVPTPPDGSGSGPEAPAVDVLNWGDFEPNARIVHPGEGGFQTLKEMGVPEHKWESVWQEAGTKFSDQGKTYVMEDGRFGWSRPMLLTDADLDVLAKAAKRNGVNLAE